MSRHSEYTEEQAIALCEQIALHGAVGKACEAVGVGRSTFYAWLAKEPDFVTMYQAAKLEYADSEFERMDTLMEAEPKKDADGNIDKAYPQLLRVKLEALKFKLRVLSPKKYSERYEVTGAEGVPLVPNDQVTQERLLEGARRMAFVLQRADQLMRRNPPGPALQLVHDVTSRE